ncbi:hypothetical protein U8527_19780 [Kordia algicida OT-1]|uniref:Uncharacterized protein n=1 Tax=Kordia algicida OT-1 TaxID=391587 RepID=A9DK35_9FLAO|nr:hypothetical protein [Kordia algicida]EDP98250.1 hypothetical protein KAOT1_13572 [Kordia algicida OT-1]
MKNKEVITGIIVGIVATIIGTCIYLGYLAYSKDIAFGTLLGREIKYGGISSDIAWGTALNFIAFYAFLKRNKEERAKGVLIVTVIIAVCVMTHRLLS